MNLSKLSRLSLVTVVVLFAVTPQSRAVFAPSEPANSPMGSAFGVKPGRVAWAFDPAATTWDGTTNSPGWWADTNTHPEVVARLLREVITTTGAAAAPRASIGRPIV